MTATPISVITRHHGYMILGEVFESAAVVASYFGRSAADRFRYSRMTAARLIEEADNMLSDATNGDDRYTAADVLALTDALENWSKIDHEK